MRLREAFDLDDDGKLKDQIDSIPCLPYMNFSDALLGAGSARLEFVRRSESKIQKFIESENSTLFLPSMPSNKRWLVRQLAPYYGLAAESFDKGEHRCVCLSKTTQAKKINFLLSEAIKEYRRHQISSKANVLEWPRGCIIQVLSTSVRDAQIQIFLSQFDGLRFVRIKSSHFLVFMNSSMMFEALDALYEDSRFSAVPASIADEQRVAMDLLNRTGGRGVTTLGRGAKSTSSRFGNVPLDQSHRFSGASASQTARHSAPKDSESEWQVQGKTKNVRQKKSFPQSIGSTKFPSSDDADDWESMA